MMQILRHLIPERIPWFAAKLYDTIAQGAIESYYRPVAEEIVAAVSKGIILDIGTGPGCLPIEVARIAPELRIEAVDLTRRMIGFARRHAKDAGVSDRITFQVGDGNRLKFREASFDMVISTGALHAWKNPVQVMRECHRVLKPGREAWIYDPAQVVTQQTEEFLRHGLRGIDRLAYKWGSWSTRVAEPLSDDRIRSILDQLDLIEKRIEKGRRPRIILKKGGP
jgi:ubiquinone/menaquinone biosynthesis C-methylase UbiE